MVCLGYLGAILCDNSKPNFMFWNLFRSRSESFFRFFRGSFRLHNVNTLHTYIHTYILYCYLPNGAWNLFRSRSESFFRFFRGSFRLQTTIFESTEWIPACRSLEASTPPLDNLPGIWTFEDWLVQIPSPRGKKAVQMPHQLVLKYLSSMTNFVFKQTLFTLFRERYAVMTPSNFS